MFINFILSLLLLSGYNVIGAYEINATGRPPPPCNVHSSILFAKETDPPGTTLLTLSSPLGEAWALIETGVKGYLTLTSGENDTRVTFLQSPDLEDISKKAGNPIHSLSFRLQCSHQGWIYKYDQELIVQDVNEYPPTFDTTQSYSVSISEDTEVGSPVFDLGHVAYDQDVTGRVKGFKLVPYVGKKYRDGRVYFQVSSDHAHIELHRPMDYDVLAKEGSPVFALNLTAQDNGLPTPLSSHVIVTFEVKDVDDQGPSFLYPDCPLLDDTCALPYFRAVVKCRYQGALFLHPAPIFAEDRDSFNNTIRYSITKVEPEGLMSYFFIDSSTGVVTLLKPTCSFNFNTVVLTVKATEVSELTHSISTTLQVNILDKLFLPSQPWQGWTRPTEWDDAHHEIYEEANDGVDDSKDGGETEVISGSDDSSASSLNTISILLFCVGLSVVLVVALVATSMAVRAVRMRAADGEGKSAAPGSPPPPPSPELHSNCSGKPGDQDCDCECKADTPRNSPIGHLLSPIFHRHDSQCTAGHKPSILHSHLDSVNQDATYNEREVIDLDNEVQYVPTRDSNPGSPYPDPKEGLLQHYNIYHDDDHISTITHFNNNSSNNSNRGFNESGYDSSTSNNLTSFNYTKTMPRSKDKSMPSSTPSSPPTTTDITTTTTTSATEATITAVTTFSSHRSPSTRSSSSSDESDILHDNHPIWRAGDKLPACPTVLVPVDDKSPPSRSGWLGQGQNKGEQAGGSGRDKGENAMHIKSRLHDLLPEILKPKHSKGKVRFDISNLSPV